MLKHILTTFSVIVAFLIIGCGPKPIEQKSATEECTKPPADTFTTAGLDVSVDSTTIGKVITGKITVNTNPQVIKFASQAATDIRVRRYLTCLMEKEQGYTPEQADCFLRRADFMSTKPNSAALHQWEKENDCYKKKMERTDAEKSVVQIKHQIEVVRGDFVTIDKYKIYATRKVRENAYPLAKQLLNINDGNLNIQHTVAKYEYAAFAIVMAASVEKEDSVRLKMANEAISVADITLELLKKVEIKASSGNSVAQEAWTFIRKAKSSERVLYLLAISQAINSAAGGGFKKEDVINTLDKIPNHYLEDFPPEHNKNLSFILSK